MGAPIVVVARWRMAEADVAEVLELANQLREQSLAEPGCLGYEVFRSAEEAGTLLLLERYRDGAAVEAHRKTPHYQSLVTGRIVPRLTGRQVDLLSAA